MEIVRCGKCNKKLAEAEYLCLEIKCPRCGTLNYLSAQRAKPERRGASVREESLHETATSVATARIDEVIVGEDYHVFPGTMLTVCCLILANGFSVTGESACASPENFNAELGRKIARENAKQKIWALEGYALRDRLAHSRFCD